MINIEDAIQAINPDAHFRCKPANSTAGITWENCEPIPVEDIVAKKAELQAAEDAAVAQEATDKTNGNQKLLDLGLSQAEVDAIIT